MIWDLLWWAPLVSAAALLLAVAVRKALLRRRPRVPELRVDGLPLNAAEQWRFDVLEASYHCVQADEVIYVETDGGDS